MAQNFSTRTLTLSGQLVTATPTSLLVNGNIIAGGGGSATNGVTGLSITGGVAISGAISINAGTNISLSQAGLNSFSINDTLNLNGLISTGSANLTYLVTGASGFWYPISNPNQFITSGDHSRINSVTGINISGGTALTGAVQFIGAFGTNVIQSGNSVAISGGPITFNSTTNITAITGTNSGIYLGLNDQVNETNLPGIPNVLEVYSKTYANKDMLAWVGDSNRPTAIAPAPWNRYVQYLAPASSTTQTVIGNGAGTNLGTLSHPVTNADLNFYGYMTNYVTAATVNSPAGTSFNIANLTKGTVTGRNGFFVMSEFALVDATGTYLSTGTAVNPTGLRFFFGVTDQTLAVMLKATSNPAGNYAGFQFVRSTGTVTRVDTNFQFTYKDNTSQTIQDCGMVFDSGLYNGYIYMPPYPNTGSMFWRLERVNPNFSLTTVTGSTTGILLPLGTAVMRAGIGIQNQSTAAKNIRTRILYAEM